MKAIKVLLPNSNTAMTEVWSLGSPERLFLLSSIVLALSLAIVSVPVYAVEGNESLGVSTVLENISLNSSESETPEIPVKSEYMSLDFSNLSSEDRSLFEEIYRQGFASGNRTGYGDGFVQGYVENPQTPDYFPDSEVVESSSAVEEDGYGFIFGEVRGEYVGMSWPENSTVKIELSSLDTADDLETLCDHEVAHQIFPGVEHSTIDTRSDDPIYKYSDDMEIKACDRLAANLSKNKFS